jgi:hypothetical protein
LFHYLLKDHQHTAKVKSRYAAGEMHSAPRAEIWVKTRLNDPPPAGGGIQGIFPVFVERLEQ